MTVESPVCALRPSRSISAMRPFSITIEQLADGLGSTQSISVAWVRTVRIMVSLVQVSFRFHAGILRDFEPATRFRFDESAEVGGTVADGFDAALIESLHDV